MPRLTDGQLARIGYTAITADGKYLSYENLPAEPRANLIKIARAVAAAVRAERDDASV